MDWIFHIIFAIIAAAIIVFIGWLCYLLWIASYHVTVIIFVVVVTAIVWYVTND